jgi:hypothetical protein
MKYVEVMINEPKSKFMVFRIKSSVKNIIEIDLGKISIFNEYEPGDATYEEITEAVNIYNERTKGESNG